MHRYMFYLPLYLFPRQFVSVILYLFVYLCIHRQNVTELSTTFIHMSSPYDGS